MPKLSHLTALQDIRCAQVLFQLKALSLVLGMPEPEAEELKDARAEAASHED